MRDERIERVEWLALRLSHLGMVPDLAVLSLADLWGLYRFLARMASEVQRGAAP